MFNSKAASQMLGYFLDHEVIELIIRENQQL